MDLGFFVGFLITLTIFIWLSLSAGTKKIIKKEGTSSLVVSGAIIGTLVGGSSTIGTAQLAYTYGMSAWWFTLGAGIGCLIMALTYVKPLRMKCKNTLTGMIRENYGQAAGLAGTCFSSAGMYINIIAQLISAAAVVMMIMPDISLFAGVAISAALMMIYAYSGGVSGVGKIGVFKTLLLYFTAIGGGVLAIYLFGGIDQLFNNEILLQGNYFSVFNRGVGTDLGNGMSVILGVLSTQTYSQAVLSGINDKEAKKGALISAVMIPPIGIGGILIGMYMRVTCPDLTVTKFALPQFIQQNMPAPVAGVIFATLLITVLGTGAGLALGVATTVRRDLIKDGTVKGLSESLMERSLIFIVLLSAMILSSGGIGEMILDFSFMSMALRAAAIFIPIVSVLYMKGNVSSRFILAGIITGPLVVLIGNLAGMKFDPLFLGIFANLAIVMVGYIKKNNPRG